MKRDDGGDKGKKLGGSAFGRPGIVGMAPEGPSKSAKRREAKKKAAKAAEDAKAAEAEAAAAAEAKVAAEKAQKGTLHLDALFVLSLTDRPLPVCPTVCS